MVSSNVAQKQLCLGFFSLVLNPQFQGPGHTTVVCFDTVTVLIQSLGVSKRLTGTIYAVYS